VTGARLRRIAGARLKWRWVAVAVVLVTGGLAAASVAWGYWTPSGATGSTAAAAATLNQGPTPTVVGEHTQVKVSWTTGTTSSGRAANGYIVRRYDAVTAVEQTVGAGCSGVITATTCTESGMPGGQWTYTVTPTIGLNWQGPESPHSGVVQTGATTLTLAKSVFGPPFPAVTTGAITGFLPGEGITYELDGSPIAGSPSVAGLDGTATITSLSIPAGLSDGTHTVAAVGNDPLSPSLAQASILIDTTAPTVTAIITPAPNAAGWNNTSPVTITAAVSTGGSGLASIAYTDDGSDPSTSPTAINGLVNGVIATVTATQTTTYKYIAVDNAGNSTPVETLTVKIDTTAPIPTAASLLNVVGGAYLDQPHGITYYRGAVAGSFQLQTSAIDPGGAAASGLASASDTALNGSDAGFSINAGTVSTPAGGPFLLSPVSWAAGTTSNPVGTVVITDVAGNSRVFPAQIVNDSAAPSGGSVTATGLTGPGGDYSQSQTVNLNLAQGTDSGSGLADGSVPADLPDTLLRASAPLSSSDGVANGTCGTYGSYVQVQSNPPASVTDTVPSDHMCYRYEYLVADHVGNVATYTSPDIKVQTTASASLTPSGVGVTPVSGVSSESVSGSTVYYNPASLGSFQVTGSASAPFSGIAQMTFPAITGFTGGGAVTTALSGTTFASTYAWTANSASSSPGVQPLSATNNAGQTATNTSAFTVIADATGPAGGSVDATGLTGTGGRYSTSTTLNIAFSKGTDTASGLASTGAQLSRASASLTAGVCGTYGAYNQVGANDPSTPYSDSVPANNTCYRYQYVVSDNVGNQTTYTSPDIEVETGLPATPTLSFSGLSNSYWSGTGSTVYYNPSASNGAFTLTANSSDTAAGVASYTLPTFPSGWSSTAGALGVETYSYTTANPTAPTGAQNVTATSNTGTQSAPASFNATPDSTGPAGGSVDATGLVGTGGRYSTSTSLSIAFSRGTDTGSGLAPAGAQLLRASASLTAGSCGTYGAYAVLVIDPVSPDSDTVPAAQKCYRYEYVVADNVGNQTTYTSPDIKVQTAAASSLTPTNATITPLTGVGSLAVSGSTIYYNPTQSGSFTVSSSASDTGSGVAQVAFPTIAGFTGGGNVITPTAGTTYTTTYSWSANGASPSPGSQSLTAADNAGLTATNNTAFSLIADNTGPAGGSVDATGLSGTGGRYSTSTTLNIALNKGTDTTSGVAIGGAQLLRASAALSSTGTANGNCGTYGSYTLLAIDPASPDSDTVPTAQRCYRYEYIVADTVGNQTTYTSPDIKVQTATPASLTPTNPTITPLTGTGSQAVSGSTVYYNPAQSGSFTVSSSASDASSGVTGMLFPTIAGFTGGGNTSTPTSGSTFTTTYSWSTNGASPSPGSQPLTAADNAGLTATNTTAFSIIADSTGPTGGSVDATGLTGTGSRYSTSTTLHIAFSKGTDAGSGLAPSGAQLLRASATLSAGSCGAYSAYNQVGANDPSSPYSDTVPANNTCYRYEYLVSDNLGNQTTYTSPDIKVDTGVPPTPTLSFSNTTNSYWSGTGNTVYYNPSASSGAFTLTASSNDTVAGTSGYGFPNLPAGWSASSGGTGIQNYSWNAANPTAPSGSQTVTATNNAGSQSSASFTATPDNAAPSGGSVSYTNGLVITPLVSVSFTAGTDSGSGLIASSGVLQRATTSLVGATCGTFGSYATIASNPTSPYTDTVPANHSCYEYRYLISDHVGNQASYTTTSIVQLATTAASFGTVTFQNAFSDNTVDGTGTVSLPTPQNGKNTACLTATGNAATPPLLSCAGAIDTQGSGTLRLTGAVGNEVGGIFDTTSFPTSNGIDVKFNSYQYGGTSADGIAFLLAAVDPADPVVPTTLASSGGALGYSATGTLSGLTNAYLGIGLDVFGNFSNKVYEGTGCTDLPQMTTAEAGAVAVRGPGNGHVGYCGLATSYTSGGRATLHGTTRANSAVPVEVLINPTNSSFTSASGLTVAAGAYEVGFTPIGGAARTLTGALPSVSAGLYPSATWLNASGIPNQLAFGFDASTGGSTDIHEISNVQVATFSSVPQLAVSTTSYSAATPSAGAPVTYGVTASVVAGANETSPISVTQTVPTGVVPVGAYGSGWTCQSPVGQSITCTTSGSLFVGGTTLPVINVDAIVTGSSVTSALVQSGSSATASSVDSNPGATSSATAGTLPSAPSSISLAPSIGPTAGGGSVTVSGSNIGSATAIEIGTTAQQQAGTPVTLLPCPGLPAAGCFTSVAGSLVISSMPALTSPANLSVTVVTSGLAAAGGYVYANAPAAPATPTATAGVTTATVTWVAPASNGSPITGYIITPYLAGTAQTPLSFDASTTTRTLTGLTHNSSYTFTVAAVNLAGTSNASSNSASVTP
jgi:Fibronectin type III domain